MDSLAAIRLQRGAVADKVPSAHFFDRNVQADDSGLQDPAAGGLVHRYEIFVAPEEFLQAYANAVKVRRHDARHNGRQVLHDPRQRRRR